MLGPCPLFQSCRFETLRRLANERRRHAAHHDAESRTDGRAKQRRRAGRQPIAGPASAGTRANRANQEQGTDGDGASNQEGSRSSTEASPDATPGLADVAEPDVELCPRELDVMASSENLGVRRTFSGSITLGHPRVSPSSETAAG